MYRTQHNGVLVSDWGSRVLWPSIALSPLPREPSPGLSRYGDLCNDWRGGQHVESGPRSVAEENARLQELIAEELAQAERWQGHYEGLLGHQARLHALLQAQSLESLEQAARALRDELEEAQGALREQQEQSRRRHVHQREKENQRLAEIIQELEGKRQLWDMEAKHQAKADRIREKQRHMEELSGTIHGLARRTQVLHGNISCWGDRVLEARQEAELFQREALYGPLGTPPCSLLWEERVRDQTEKLLCQESGASGPRGRLPPRLRLAGQLFWALAKGLFLALLGPLVLGPLRALLSCLPPVCRALALRVPQGDAAPLSHVGLNPNR
ncbi:uncharacterized protein LOC128828475 [Malaclemys terrapin pileata]|uniref:uncharacterized protein LOC128828475 n=1 Tax=Malaclemys terrapin pileata TaxID=2991368 RepID=UPI0023A905F8|nr:uncharacterized protein LOC128828475 [Malaclemys terrapin pileata]